MYIKIVVVVRMILNKVIIKDLVSIVLIVMNKRCKIIVGGFWMVCVNIGYIKYFVFFKKRLWICCVLFWWNWWICKLMFNVGICWIGVVCVVICWYLYFVFIFIFWISIFFK